MFALIRLFIALICNRFRSRHWLEIENLYLRHQLNIAMRCTAHRLRLRRSDRALLVWMTWLWPNLLSVSRVVRPDTILRWHRAGFRAYWRWKSRGQPGRTNAGDSDERHALMSMNTASRLRPNRFPRPNPCHVAADLTYQAVVAEPDPKMFRLGSNEPEYCSEFSRLRSQTERVWSSLEAPR